VTYSDTVVRTARYCDSLTVRAAEKILGVRRGVLNRFLKGTNIASRNYFRILAALDLLETLALHKPKVLTAHELTVMRRLSQGLCRKEIAAELGCSVKAVDVALNSIARKIGLQEVNVALMTRWAMAKGM